MIPFETAKEKMLAGVEPITDIETVAVTDALGRVLSAPVVAPLNVPTHANSSMDGYALRHRDLKPSEQTRLRVVGEIPAGSYRQDPLAAGETVRIMTGAPLPDGCDCVVIQENVEREADWIAVPSGQSAGQYIRPAGEDLQLGTTVFEAGRRLAPADMGLLTAMGLASVTVFRRIKVGILSTGDEVTPAGQTLLPGHVYDSNRVSLIGALQALGAEILDLGLARDRREEIAAALRIGAETADAIITSGGVSEGDFDLVKDVIGELGVIDFWKVRMRPGKPQAHGRLGRALFFGLPGNPVSTLAVFLLMVRPALLKLMGSQPAPPRRLKLPLRGRIAKDHDRMDFQRAIVHFEAEHSWVESTGNQSSGALSSLARGNAFVVLPVEPVRFEDGDEVEVWLLE